MAALWSPGAAISIAAIFRNYVLVKSSVLDRLRLPLCLLPIGHELLDLG
jgi:hypothetical protein